MNRCLLVVSFLLSFHTAFGSVYFRHIGKNDGLSQQSVMSIYQDELGRMWFGTLEGISMYDGEKTTAFKPSAEGMDIIGNETHFIVGDKKGNLLFTSDSMLIHYDIYQERFTCLRKKGASCLHARNDKIWMATRDSVYAWNISEKKFDYFSALKGKGHITQLYDDGEQGLWVGTSQGLYRLDQQKKTATCLIPQIHACAIYKDSRQQLWVADYRNGICKLSNGALTRYKADGGNAISNNDVRGFVEDNQGNLWIATYLGLNKLDVNGRFSNYTKDVLPGSLRHSSVFSLCKDVQGTIWVGTFYGGVHYFNPETNIFSHYSENVNRDDCLSYFFVGKMVEDKRHNLWMCTEGGGLNFFDRKTRKFTHYMAEGKENKIPFNSLKCIAYDEKRDRLYIGTHTRGFFSLDIQTNQVKHYDNQNKKGNTVIHLAIQGSSLILISNLEILAMDLDTEEIRPLLKNCVFRGINTFFFDSKGYLWLSLFDKIIRMNVKEDADRRIFNYGERGIGKFLITQIVEDHQGTILLGTLGAGVFRYNEKTDDFAGYINESGWMPNKYCYSMTVSNQGRLVISGDQGITLFDPIRQLVRNIDLENELPLTAINEGCGLLACQDGEIFVGGIDGMTSFQERDLFLPKPDYNLYFSSLHVNNELIRPGNSDILSTALPFTQEVCLKYNQNNIAVGFAINNYTGKMKRNLYEYKLEGFDHKWISYTGHDIVYTNLSPGHYTLFVREQGQGSGRPSQMIQLSIVVHDPWFTTVWAYLCYLLVVVGIAYILIRNKRAKMRLERSLVLERLDKEKKEEVMQAKLQFFSNISHEFRTPLTLIISQIEILLQYKGVSPFLHNRLLKIEKTTFQLRELISELLDFRKLERGGVTLKVSRLNLVSFLQMIFQSFEEQAVLQGISYHFSSSCESIECYFDAKQLKKVFFNLLSNAFKYTPESGKIELLVKESDQEICISVMDSGHGISQKALPHVFDRFFQGDTTFQTPGTGIGLALTKGLVELHHGRIEVQSALEYGTIFTVSLPKNNPFASDEHVEWLEAHELPSDIVLQVEPTAFFEDQKEATPENPDEGGQDKFSVLIVEDNEELLQLLTMLLSPMYKVAIALNGKEGLQKALDECPDLILSDVMMPIMSGTEMCMKIKTNFDLCHIPVVLLTALTSDEQNIEGLQCGADDYIGKPFNNKLLQNRIANLIRNRKLLQQKYVNVSASGGKELEELAITPTDQKFLALLNKVIEEHLSDTEFDVNMLAQEVGVSRSSLYNKLKALSSLTPNEFVLNIRLKKAALLLKNNPELQITEIAYQLGFSSLRYFRHCFKAQYGKAPQEFRNE